MAHADVIAIAQHLVTRISTSPTASQTLSPVDLVYGENCRPHREFPPSEDQSLSGAIPLECVFIVPTSSGPEIVETGATDVTNTANWPRVRAPGFTITVRGRVGEYDRTAQLADAIYNGLHFNPPTDYLDIALGEPVYVGEDPRNADIFTITGTAYTSP